MKVSEYDILRRSFEDAFPFMINRINEVIEPQSPVRLSEEKREEAVELCWGELLVALNDLGATLEGTFAQVRDRGDE